MNKAKKLICFILQAGILVTLFVPNMFGEQLWQYDNSIVYHGIATLKSTESLSFLNEMDYGMPNLILGILVIVLAVACLFIFGLSCFSLKRIPRKLQLFLLCGQFAAFACFAVITLLSETEYEHWSYRGTDGVMLYVESILYLVLIMVTFIKDPPEMKELKATGSGNPDDLKKYKELLDSGIITQKEFDEKKKQILGL